MSPNELILLVAQNNREIYEIERVLSFLPSKCRLHVVRRFEEVSCYFGGTGIYSNRRNFPLPSLVLLDLTLTDASRIINWVRSASSYPQIPFVGMGDFKHNYRIQAAFDSGINAYCDKSNGFSELATVILHVHSLPALPQRLNSLRPLKDGSNSYVTAA